MNTSNNTILITGGASGIGLELTKQLSLLSNTIIITGRNQAKLDDVKKQIPKVHTIQSDVTDTQSIEALFNIISKDFPDLNVLINNAGIMRTINLHETTDSLTDITQEIDTNLNGPIRMVKQFLPHLKTRKNAAIMNVTSGLAFVPLPTAPVYSATKAGLHFFTLSLRVQLSKTNIKVFELAPPATQTHLLNQFDKEDMKEVKIMKVQAMVSAAIKGMKNDQYEIRPGQSNQLKIMSRLAPGFTLGQLSKPVERMLCNLKH
ncbi:MAG: SDR family NAD(P)-dependent oxidoreductase [Halobacteriovoraceae bacterium]|jgi:uncharacterized oxidoreductase|nr:SDR family NAD(P)-dependent oxidoreductase [Halobacteriovoraceae bacterium]